MIKYEIKNDTTLEIQGNQIKFDYDINNIIENKNVLIVHLFVKKGKPPLNNIYAISDKGDIIWNIRDFVQEDYCYTGISVDDNGNLIANTFIGIAQIIDVKNKKLVGRKVTK
ncbi:hypothetical protein H0A61_01660 [Koleobacter methoxysyntrophicus]|jgi:hypothetical protein|uniref:Uncharacterized protein n=1 Tax=Koleobacter methoxysyntrophicus TaxID=2751313 RepID=A0A8A0RP75_9FIRM|nr:hypothetical protein [Koleobacter methoxysyntrophicus]NPV43876.1 hypothetical protein [Bacillota bacterium]QSQ09299.1 hypothetical protein H0A61_01660 [Koleobacter methoxysyntrophicus]